MAESYWKTVELQVGRRQFRVTLDSFNANRLLAGDAELTKTILQEVEEVERGSKPEASVVTSLPALPVGSAGSSPAEGIASDNGNKPEEPSVVTSLPALPDESAGSSSTPRVLSEGIDPDKKIWLDKETKMFVTLRVEADDRFKAAKVHKQLWNDIANKMREGGVDVTSEQCCNKWKAIKRAYKETVDHNNLTGADRKTCKFYEELDTLYGTRAGTSPAFTLGTMKPDSNADVQGSSINKAPNDLSVTEIGLKTQNPARKHRKKQKTATVQWLEQYASRQEEMQQRRDEQLLKMHNDKMSRIDRLLDFLEKDK